MLTSLKVVNMAVVWLASSKRSAMRARSRVIGTRRSVRSPAGAIAAAAATGVAPAAGAGAGVADFFTGGAALATCFSTSSFVILPLSPVPGTSAAVPLE